ncbi:MAG TPA: hypothetical protein VL984_14920 [Acidimicrobiales bacterium]|nr:hypothetical protein [Acidimicrobiales bacterium]
MTKSDILDERIRLLVGELVGSAPMPPPLPDPGAQRRWRQRRHRRLVARSLASVVAAAAIALAALLAPTLGVTSSPRWALAGAISPSWSQVAGPSPTFAFSLTCPGATTCYAESPASVEVTRDGGKAWQSAPTQGASPLSNVACSATMQCAFLEAGSNGKPVFLTTGDAGTTWVTHAGPAGLSRYYSVHVVPVPAGVSTGPAVAGAVRILGPIDLSCPRASVCTVVVPNGAFVTVDGGRKWSAAAPPWPPSLVQCFPDARCVTVGPSGASYSTDNGLRWSPADDPAFFLGPFGPPGGLSCSSPETCLAVLSPAGEPGATLLVSSDGGESWSPLKVRGLAAGRDYTSLSCPAASQCWMSGNAPVSFGGRTVYPGARGVVLSTSNGGRNWQSMVLPGGISSIDAIYCPSTRTCYALASRGPVLPSAGRGAARPSFVLLAYAAPGH